MGKKLHDDILDSPADNIADNGNQILLCEGEPATYTEATTTRKLCSHNLTVGDGNGDYTVADNDTGGRKLTVAQQADITISASGQGDHAAIVDTVNSKLLLVTTVASQQLTAGGTVTIPSFAARFPDPV